MTPNKRATLKTAALLLIFLVILDTGMAMIVYSMTQPPLPGVSRGARLMTLLLALTVEYLIVGALFAYRRFLTESRHPEGVEILDRAPNRTWFVVVYLVGTTVGWPAVLLWLVSLQRQRNRDAGVRGQR